MGMTNQCKLKAQGRARLVTSPESPRMGMTNQFQAFCILATAVTEKSREEIGYCTLAISFGGQKQTWRYSA
ncbi:hypothetical protein CEXT_351381 [Caerostris extrusa]|uniref:Uncharacterized protein n=1 Tax=Caerostris extrusa TaxID=172846 RepID=A0AAV4RM94_CAEEX|nr:hypothetical protein CEXT_351381 [Caerostris extrusa]